MAGSPQKIASSLSEDAEQTALFTWCAMAHFAGRIAADDERSYSENGFAASNVVNPVTELQWFFSIPNGGNRSAREGMKLKGTGVRAGVSDTFLPVPRHGMHGLFIEMKKADGGTESPKQKEFGTFVQENGYGYCVCHGWEKARDILVQYLSL